MLSVTVACHRSQQWEVKDSRLSPVVWVPRPTSAVRLACPRECHQRAFSSSLGAQGKFVALYLLGMLVPYLYALYLVWAVCEMFTPILGRSGSEIPPDVVLASILAGCTMVLSSYFVRKKCCCFLM